jgi:DNA-binding transcriptional MerR regulator
MSTGAAGTLAPREVAHQTGVSPDTLRHYERKGLLPRPARTAAGYRRYAPDAVPRVRLIQRALLIGFSLDELARLFGERARGTPPCRKVRALVAERLDGLEARLEALTMLRDDLRVLLAEWDERLARTPDGTPARLLETLATDAAARQRPTPNDLAGAAVGRWRLGAGGALVVGRRKLGVPGRAGKRTRAKCI